VAKLVAVVDETACDGAFCLRRESDERGA